MNNATHESSFHPVSAPDNKDEADAAPEEFNDASAQKECTTVLNQLDKIRYEPRAATIRAILKYAQEKNEAIH